MGSVLSCIVSDKLGPGDLVRDLVGRVCQALGAGGGVTVSSPYAGLSLALEALGLANREQAGVLESQRKQAAYGILAPFFDSMRLYRREQGRTLLYYLRKYIADGRWIRLLGQGAQSAIQLNKLPDSVSFDIIVDQAPTAPDVKQRTWESLIQILPAMMKAGIPIPPDLLDYTPLPTQLAQSWKQFIQQAQGYGAEGCSFHRDFIGLPESLPCLGITSR